MDNNKLVNKYYLKILKYGLFGGNSINVLKHTKDIKERLGKIIEVNNDYLLTDSLLSFIAYMGWYDSINLYLDGLYDQKLLNEYEAYATLFEYYQKLSYTIYNQDNEIYYDTANEETRKLATKGARLIRNIKENSKLSVLTEYERLCIENIAFTTMAYCHINRNLDMYDELFTELMRNYKSFIDELVLNGDDELLPLANRGLTYRVINYIEKNNNKKIIK